MKIYNIPPLIYPTYFYGGGRCGLSPPEVGEGRDDGEDRVGQPVTDGAEVLPQTDVIVHVARHHVQVTLTFLIQ